MRFWRRSAARVAPAYDEIGDEVSVEGVICQAAQAIDIAGKLAAKQQNSERMLQTAEYWTKLADFIVNLSEYQDKRQADRRKTELQMGFQSSKVEQTDEHEIIAENEDEEVVRDDTD